MSSEYNLVLAPHEVHHAPAAHLASCHEASNNAMAQMDQCYDW